jgi:hypothetical protein
MTSTLPAWCRRNNEIMPAAAAGRDIDQAAVLARCSPRWEGIDGYTAYWGDGAPLGNGDFGAMVYGAPDNLSFLLGKNDLWLRSTTRSLFPGESFQHLVDIYRRQDREAFKKLAPTDPAWRDTFRPSTLTNAGFLTVNLAEASSTARMSQELRLGDATWHAWFETSGLDNMWPEAPDHEIEAFVSAPDEVLVIRIRRSRLPLRPFSWRLSRPAHELLPPPEVDANDQMAWLEQELLQGDRYAIAVLQTGVGLELTPARRAVLAETCADPIHETVFYVALATSNDGENPLEIASDRVSRAADRGYAALHADHAAGWSTFWQRSGFTCSEPKVEKAWYVSNYLTGSILRPGKTSPGLQGMWCKENFPPWCADFHGNANIQAIYQGVLGANHIDLFEPYAALYWHMRPQCRRDTESFFKLPGVRYPHAGSIDGHEMTEPDWITLAASYTPSSWIARMFWWVYQHTGDREFLATVAYPILKDVAEFYAGILDFSGKDSQGRYRIVLSIWGEDNATTLDGWGESSIYDLCSFMAAFQQAADAAALLEVDETDRTRWTGMRQNLPDLPVDEEGVWLKWPDHPKNARFTALSLYQQVFPSEIASLYSGPEKLRRQAMTSWWNHARHTMNSSWIGGTPSVGAMRLGDREWAWKSLAAGGTNTGIGGSKVAGLIQADHGPGLAFGINSACALVDGGLLVLFAGIPPEIDAAFHSLRVPGALLVSAEQRGGQVIHVAIQSLHGGPICLLNPFNPVELNNRSPVDVHVIGDEGSVLEARLLDHSARLEWQGKAGVVYRVATV